MKSAAVAQSVKSADRSRRNRNEMATLRRLPRSEAAGSSPAASIFSVSDKQLESPPCPAQRAASYPIQPVLEAQSQVDPRAASSTLKQAATFSGKNEPQRDLATGGGRP